ncbi:MAG: efflux RND transporter periplasmic adaptor subunit [Bacteroidetes bacterium]|nr:efflux RND transporter periplasmic adaptor subunit [Bacteroidota bacterium]
MKKLIYPAILIAILTGCSPKNQETASEKNIAVSASEVKSERMEVNLRYSGTIEASQTIPLTFQTTGTVETVLVDAGDVVKKGQLLATIDNSNSQNMYEITLSKYQQAKDAYDRLKTVHDQGSLSEIKWVEMETNLEQAKSSLALSKSNLDKCNLRAPLDGIIGRRNIEPGMSSVGISSSPFELVEINTVNVKISVPENEIGKIKKGEKASFIVSALNNKQFEGVITNVSPVADAFSRTYEAKISLKNPNLELKPGMVCDVTLNITTEKEMVLIPYQSVSKDKNGKACVYIIDASRKRAKKQIVETGNYYGNNLEILSGLCKGQMIVSEGKDKLSDNSLINL